MANIRPTYDVEKVDISFADLSNGKFIPAPNKRKIRRSVVKEIYEQLKLGKHFQSAICVNRKNRANHLFDGHHRFYAIKKYLDENPKDTVQVTLHVYHNLTDDEEKEEYTMVNKGTKQSANDVVKQYQDEITAFQHMQKGWTGGQFVCAVSAYPGPNAISFFKLVAGYILATRPTFDGAYFGSPWEFIEDAKKLKLEDVKIMNAFVIDFINAFGPLKNNKMLRNTPFYSVFRIWMDNRTRISPMTMVRIFKQRLGNDAQVDELSKGGGSGACQVARQMFITLLNANRRKDLFV